jgi:hypothetical protein
MSVKSELIGHRHPHANLPQVDAARSKVHLLPL